MFSGGGRKHTQAAAAAKGDGGGGGGGRRTDTESEVMFIFMCILYDVYQLMGLLARGLRQSLLELLAYAAWDAVHLTQLVSLTAACHLAAAHADAASRQVTRLVLAQPSLPSSSCTSMSEELHSFSLQLLHSRLEFSACGLFAFDLRMLPQTVISMKMVVLTANQVSISERRVIFYRGAPYKDEMSMCVYTDDLSKPLN
ncbi:Gustatory receptor [Gryllus bimaculatus]|nr:Gustatory receptor [Gryllus bimaculatus]